MTAPISAHFLARLPSPIRQAQIAFAERPDRNEVEVINLAIGNVSRPMHPAMQARLRSLGGDDHPFAQGVVKYTASVGEEETQNAFLNIIASSGANPEGLGCVITDGGSAAMELMILGVCGPAGQRPLLLLDPAYTNYMDLARRVAVNTISVRRELADGGVFTAPPMQQLKQIIQEHNPAGLVIIPADNPTGHFMTQEEIEEVARLCVEHNMWLVSDEAYRQLQYNGNQSSTIWRLTEERVPGITGQRISIESASKVWNACGLRIGALCTDNPELHAKVVAEYTANLSANSIGQYIFGALAHVSHDELRSWYKEQCDYYARMMREVAEGLRAELPGVIVSNPAAALYSVVDVRNLVPSGFQAVEFVRYCATQGRVNVGQKPHTLLVSPMGGFYGQRSNPDASDTQMRMAFVAPPEQMAKVPSLFAQLLTAYLDGAS